MNAVEIGEIKRSYFRVNRQVHDDRVNLMAARRPPLPSHPCWLVRAIAGRARRVRSNPVERNMLNGRHYFQGLSSRTIAREHVRLPPNRQNPETIPRRCTQ